MYQLKNQPYLDFEKYHLLYKSKLSIYVLSRTNIMRSAKSLSQFSLVKA